MPGLVVAERPQCQRLVAGLLFLADLGQEEGLCSAGAVRINFLGRYLFNIKASDPGQSLRRFRHPDAAEDNEEEA